MSNFIQVTPFMQVENLDRALLFFTGILGFETRFRTADSAYVHRETAGFRIWEQTGADQLYAELKPKLDTLPRGDVYGPVNQSYGQRELLLLAPDGNLLAFGQAIAGTGSGIERQN